jgi:hypothetical protein
MPPFLESAFRYLRQQGLPVGLKPGSRFGKAGRCSVAMLSRMQTEAAGPLPSFDVDRNASQKAKPSAVSRARNAAEALTQVRLQHKGEGLWSRAFPGTADLPIQGSRVYALTIDAPDKARRRTRRRVRSRLLTSARTATRTFDLQLDIATLRLPAPSFMSRLERIRTRR